MLEADAPALGLGHRVPCHQEGPLLLRAARAHRDRAAARAPAGSLRILRRSTGAPSARTAFAAGIHPADLHLEIGIERIGAAGLLPWNINEACNRIECHGVPVVRAV